MSETQESFKIIVFTDESEIVTVVSETPGAIIEDVSEQESRA